jgi:transcriptional regulator with XRE-family HTH domain
LSTGRKVRIMTLAGALLESGRRYRGISRHQLAREAGGSAAGLVEVAHGRKDATADRLDNLLRLLGYQLATLPTRRATAAATAELVRELLVRDDEANALRVVWQLADDLVKVEPALRVALAVTPPATTDDARFDALLAAVVDHVLVSARLPRPGWLDEPTRSLAEPWDVESVPALRAAARAVTPKAISKHGVFLDPSELVNL